MSDRPHPDAISRVTREESGPLLALLTRRFGDLDLAQEALQDALVEASIHWPISGVPSNPGGWLHTVARRKAVDRLRREASIQRRIRFSAAELATGPNDSGATDSRAHITDENDHPNGDEHLRLVLLCCHPALDLDAQVALTLRLVGGLTTEEIAAAFLTPEPTLAQRIVRAKRKIRDAGIPLSLPADVRDRLDSVLAVLYLIFNEGYLSRSGAEATLRIDLMAEALRLTSVVAGLMPDEPEALGLLALEQFHVARSPTRFDQAGDLVLLAQQDRSRWDGALIRQANNTLNAALAQRRPGPFQMQAVIAGYHTNARTASDTDWVAIVGLYDALVSMTNSPVVRVNRAVAIGMADGPLAALRALDNLDDLAERTRLHTYHLWHAARAEFLTQIGRYTDARHAFQHAHALTSNPSEKRHLERRLAAVSALTEADESELNGPTQPPA